MKRSEANFNITNIDTCKAQMLHWANQCNICVILDNHQYTSAFQKTEYLVAAGAIQTFSTTPASLAALSRFIHEEADWLFGHINYDFKYANGPSVSPHYDPIGFPDIFFFQPETILQLTGNTLTIASSIQSPTVIWQELIQTKCGNDSTMQNNLHMQARISSEDYFAALEQLLQHIKRGDCYELNFCQEFFATDASIDPIATYQQLTKISPNPFAAFYKLEDKYVLCASPERFLQKKNNRLISQPIKGTYRRNTKDVVADDALRQALKNSEKDKSENVMVVDLVRNDLSKVCVEGTVVVEELFGIYSFPQVHQMISTISGELREGVDFFELLTALFPMGSMTGAPKQKVMELIEKYEKTKRGIYSGAIGYISPEKDFDFNVVIRSILYNATNHYVSYLVGGGITAYSDPQKEYNECLLKAAAIKEVLTVK